MAEIPRHHPQHQIRQRSRSAIRNSLPENLLRRLLSQNLLTQEEADVLVTHGTELLRREVNVLRLEAPIYVIGDIHGQFFDLANLMEQLGEVSMRS